MLKRIAIGAEKNFDDLADCLQRGIRELHANGLVTGRRMLGEVAYYTVEWEREHDSEHIRNLLARELTELITSVWERKVIESQLIEEHTYYDADEIQYLTEQAVKHLSAYRRTRYSAQRKIEIELLLRKYLKEHSILQLEGFIRFRLKSQEQDRQVAIERAIDEYLMDREYQDFITLLRTFLSVQAPRVPLLHLLIGDGWNQLVDENGSLMNDEDVSRISDDTIESSMQHEDMLISTIISLAPRKLLIHLPNELSEESILLDTATRVFEERAEICTGCAVCQLTLDIGIKTVT